LFIAQISTYKNWTEEIRITKGTNWGSYQGILPKIQDRNITLYIHAEEFENKYQIFCV
jgi:hypothetical protein